MDKTDNQEVINYRDQLRGRMATRYPERNFSSQNVQEGQNSQDDLDKALMEALDDYDAKLSESNSNNDRLTKLFNSDPRSASFLNRWVTAGDPLVALVEIFGDDLKEALDSPENRERFLESHAKWLERKTADEAASEEADRNFDESLKVLQAFGQEKGLDDGAQMDLMIKARSIAEDAIQGVYKRETFEMIYNAGNYAGDVEKARKEGEVAGRNAKIDEVRRYRQDSAASMPPSLNGTSSAAAQPKKKSKVASMFGLED